MASKELYNDDDLNEQTWLYYVNEKTKHLKFNIEEWLKCDTCEGSEIHANISKLDNLENDSGLKDKENIPVTFQPSPMILSDQKVIQDTDKIKLNPSDVSKFKMKPRIGESVGLQQCWNFTMEGLDMNRTLLEDVKLSFDSSLECYNSSNFNGKKDAESPADCSPVLADKEINFCPEKVSTPEIEIRRYQKPKKGHLQTSNHQPRDLQNKLSVERLNDQIIEDRCQVLNDTFVLSEQDLSKEGKKDFSKQCSPKFSDKERNSSEKVLTQGTGIQRFGKTKKGSLLKPVHRSREFYRKQSLERLNDSMSEDQNHNLDATFSVSANSLDKEDFQTVVNTLNHLKIDNVENAETPVLQSPLKDREKNSQIFNSHVHDLNETFIQESSEYAQSNEQREVACVQNNEIFTTPEVLPDKEGSYPSMETLNTYEDYKIPENVLPLKTVNSRNVIENVTAGPSAPTVNKKIPKKLGSRLPMPVNRGALSRTRIPVVPGKK